MKILPSTLILKSRPKPLYSHRTLKARRRLRDNRDILSFNGRPLDAQPAKGLIVTNQDFGLGGPEEMHGRLYVKGVFGVLWSLVISPGIDTQRWPAKFRDDSKFLAALRWRTPLVQSLVELLITCKDMRRVVKFGTIRDHSALDADDESVTLN